MNVWLPSIGSNRMNTTNKQNIIKCNSLSENPLMINTKVDAIVTNPPFGTKMNYKSLKAKCRKNKEGILKIDQFLISISQDPKLPQHPIINKIISSDNLNSAKAKGDRSNRARSFFILYFH